MTWLGRMRKQPVPVSLSPWLFVWNGHNTFTEWCLALCWSKMCFEPIYNAACLFVCVCVCVCVNIERKILRSLRFIGRLLYECWEGGAWGLWENPSIHRLPTEVITDRLHFVYRSNIINYPHLQQYYVFTVMCLFLLRFNAEPINRCIS